MMLRSSMVLMSECNSLGVDYKKRRSSHLRNTLAITSNSKCKIATSVV